MKNTVIRTLYELISKDFGPNTRAEILVSLYKVWPQNKLKGLVFSVISLEGEVNFFIGQFLEVLLFSVVKLENLEGDFLRSLFPNFVLPVIENYDAVFLQILCRK